MSFTMIYVSIRISMSCFKVVKNTDTHTDINNSNKFIIWTKSLNSCKKMELSAIKFMIVYYLKKSRLQQKLIEAVNNLDYTYNIIGFSDQSKSIEMPCVFIITKSYIVCVFDYKYKSNDNTYQTHNNLTYFLDILNKYCNFYKSNPLLIFQKTNVEIDTFLATHKMIGDLVKDPELYSQYNVNRTKFYMYNFAICEM